MASSSRFALVFAALLAASVVAQPSPTGGLTGTQNLFVDWSWLAVPPDQASSPCGMSNTEQAADVGTLFEVLTADDNDGNLYNGTPNDAVICAAFAAHSIEPSTSTEPNPCEESAHSGGCYADFDESGACDVFDVIRFVSAFESGTRIADCDRSGVLDARDFVCFQAAFRDCCGSAGRSEVTR